MPDTDDPSHDFDSDMAPCSYCGKSVYADSPRCPSCGNYTDGLGKLADAAPGERRLPRIFLIAGWIVAGVLILPIVAMAVKAAGVLLQTFKPPH